MSVPSHISPSSLMGDRKVSVLIVAACVLVHVGRTLALFSHPADAFDARPIVSGDHPFHIFFAHRGLDFLRLHGADWGYVPDFLGGFPKTAYYDASVVPLEAASAASGLSVERTDKVLVLIVPLLELTCTVIAALLLGACGRVGGCGGKGVAGGEAIIAVAAMAQVAFFWLGDGWLLLAVGLTAFLLASSLFLIIAAAWLTDRPWMALVLAPVLTFAHPHGVPLLALVAGARLCAERPSRGLWLRTLMLLAAGMLGLLPLTHSLVAGSSLVVPSTRAVQFVPDGCGDVLRYLTCQGNYNRSGGPIAAVFWIAALLAAGGGLPAGRRAGRLLLASLFVLTFLAGLHPALASIQPTRMKHPLALLALAMGAHVLWRALARAWESPVLRATTCGGAVLTLAMIVVLGVRSHPVMRVGLSDQERELVSFIVAQVGANERVLLESSEMGGIFGYGSSDVGVLPLLPLLTGRAFLNAPNVDVFLIHGAYHPADGSWLGVRADALPSKGVDRVLSVMGVRLVGVISGAMRRAIERLPRWRRVRRIGRLFLYRLDTSTSEVSGSTSGPGVGPVGSASGGVPGGVRERALDLVVEGSARVRWTAGIIDLSDVHCLSSTSQTGERLTLAFNYDAELVAQPACVIEPVRVSGLPLPLIGLLSPPVHVVLGPKGGWSIPTPGAREPGQ